MSPGEGQLSTFQLMNLGHRHFLYPSPHLPPCPGFSPLETVSLINYDHNACFQSPNCVPGLEVASGTNGTQLRNDGEGSCRNLQQCHKKSEIAVAEAPRPT